VKTLFTESSEFKNSIWEENYEKANQQLKAFILIMHFPFNFNLAYDGTKEKNCFY